MPLLAVSVTILNRSRDSEVWIIGSLTFYAPAAAVPTHHNYQRGSVSTVSISLITQLLLAGLERRRLTAKRL